MNITRKIALVTAIAMPLLATSASAQNKVQRNFYKVKINSKLTVQDGIDDTDKGRFNTNDVIDQLVILLGQYLPVDGRARKYDLIAEIGDDEVVVDEVQFWLVYNKPTDKGGFRIMIPKNVMDVGQGAAGLTVYKRKWTAKNSTVKIESTASGDTLMMNFPEIVFGGQGLTTAKLTGKDFHLEAKILNGATIKTDGDASAVIFPLGNIGSGELGVNGVADFKMSIGGGNIKNEKFYEIRNITPDVVVPVT